MRQRSMLCIVLCVSAGFAQGLPHRQIASVSFIPGSADCFAVIHDRREKKASSPPKEVLTIQCGSKQLLSYSRQDGAVDIFTNCPHADRVFVRWEGGAHVSFTVFWVAKDGSSARKVFDRMLEGSPDVIDSPDVLLVHSGKRWVDGEASSIPLKTEVYAWTGETYQLSETWKWQRRMQFNDRFCVLDPKVLNCPANLVPHK